MKCASISIRRSCPRLPHGWVRDYFFVANGYEKDMDFYASDGNTLTRYRSARWAIIRIPGNRFLSMTSTELSSGIQHAIYVGE